MPRRSSIFCDGCLKIGNAEDIKYFLWWVPQNRECRGDQVFFVMAMHETQFVYASPNHLITSCQFWWKERKISPLVFQRVCMIKLITRSRGGGLPWPENPANTACHKQNHRTAISTLLGLISSVYRVWYRHVPYHNDTIITTQWQRQTQE